jgi:hypothetical protein
MGVSRSRERMVDAITACINKAEFDWSCSGIQTEHVQDLQLEELSLANPVDTVNEILAIVAGYISEVL